MEKNESTTDRVIRIIIGVLLIAFGFFQLVNLLQLIAYVLGLIAIGTGISGFCGLYTLFGISTCKIKKEKDSQQNK